MRRVMAALASLSLLLTIPVASSPAVAAPTDLVSRLGVDMDAVRDALASGAAEVGPAPEEAAAYFADRPLQWFHPTSETITHTQPDGTIVTASILEIADGGGQATTTGHLITKADSGWWEYGIRQADGTIAATGARAGVDAAPDGTRTTDMPVEFRDALAEREVYAEQLDSWFHSRAAAQARAAAAAGEPLVFKVPALMLAINNEEFQPENTAEVIQDSYTGIGTSPTGTVTEMYWEQSFGNLIVQVDVYGPYTSAISMNPVNDCWYGTDGGPILGEQLGLGGYGAKGLALEAVPMADPEVDFAQYDGDGDNYVDFLMIVHSGRGAETTGDPCDVHSHRFAGLLPALVDGAPSEPTPLSVDGVLIGQALTVPELDAGIGVVAHELMHAFGEPDYYGTAGNAGTGDWDLGGGGSYGGVPTQSSPLHFNPVMKINFGWVEPTRIDDTTLDVELRPRASNPDLLMVPTRVLPEDDPDYGACDNDVLNTGVNQVANFIDDDGNCLAEGYLIEFMSPTSASWDAEQCVFTPADFDRQMYGTGVAVWHYDLTSYVQLGNNNVLRPMLDIEEFDRRDASQDLETGRTRAQPLDLFWGDPVGVSSATAADGVDAASLEPPAGSPYTVTAAPATAAYSEPWTTAADAPEGALMRVTLDWSTSAVDDWDLAVQKQAGDDWVEVATSGAPPASGPEIAEFTLQAGATYRAEAVNYASASPSATVAVEYIYDDTIAYKFGPANTLNADSEATGWAFTNIRPNDYLGMATPMQAADAVAVLDLIKHDDTTVDVSGDFLYPVTADELAEPIVAGTPVTLRSRVYNHGGADVTGATFQVWDGQPTAADEPLATFTRDLAAFSSDDIEFEFTPEAGANELFVSASVDGDVSPGNDLVRTEILANPDVDATVLVVDNDLGWTQEQSVQASLLSLGVDHHVVDGEPGLATLEQYDAVIWLTSGVSGAKGVMSPAAWAALTAYLDGGGNAWVSSNRFAGYAANEAINEGQRLADYFGVVGINNILDPFGDVMTGQGDAIGGTREVEMSYIDGRPYLDYVDLTDSPNGTAVPLFIHEQRPENPVATKLDGGTFRTVLSPALTGIADGAEQQLLTAEVLDFLGVATGAPDADDERVVFNRFQHVQTGAPWPVTVGAPSADEVTFHHRIHGDDTWSELVLDEPVDGLFTGTLPADAIANNGLDYYVSVTRDGEVDVVDGGPSLPNVASGTYGDPADVDFGACAAAAVDGEGDDGDDDTDGDVGDDSAPLPATGGGLAIAGLLAVAAASTRRRS